LKPFWWLVSLALMAVIWALSSSSTPLAIPLPHPLDWAGHTLEYLVLAFSLGRATGNRSAALLLAVWFGAADEVHQAFVAGREAGIQDWFFDLLGAWLGSRLAVQDPRQAQPLHSELKAGKLEANKLDGRL
jgi:VanZ family protein